MERRTFLKGTGAVLLLNNACATTQSIVNHSPPAKTPVLTSLSSVVATTCAWTEMSPNVAGNWDILPSGHPSGDIRVKFKAPYPSRLSVDVDGQHFLREFDNTQSAGEGYYKINSVTLAAALDTYDWDVTVTPPASVRVNINFRLNVADVSLNPAYTGTDQTSAPLALQLERRSQINLSSWLFAHQNVRNAIVWETGNGAFDYSHWTTQDQNFLRDAFSSAWSTLFPLLEDPPRNTATLADTDEPTTVLAEGDAWPLYVSHIAYSLAAEIAGWTSWSITSYTSDQLAILFDSREMFRWDSSHNGYVIKEGTGVDGVVPASPWTTLLFLYQNDIYTCRSRVDVIARALEWCRSNLVHFTNDFQAKNMEDLWQYRGCPPVLRMIQGTPDSSSGNPGILHRTGGCWGTTAFLRAILRVLNIPVKHQEHAGHAMPYFMTEGLYLSHGDDPYNRFSIATPSFPASELLIDQATYDLWFGGLFNTQQAQNIGRRPRELAIKYLPNDLLQLRCTDRAANTPMINSEVFKSLQFNYTVADLQASDLWGRLDAKIASFDGCMQIPP